MSNYPRISRRIATIILVVVCATTFLATHVPKPGSMIPIETRLIPHFDKFVHATIYATLAIALLIALRSWKFRWCWQLAAAVFLWLLAWGIFDELTQKLVAGRTADPADLLADALGACLGIGVIAVLRKIGNSQPLEIASEDVT